MSNHSKSNRSGSGRLRSQPSDHNVGSAHNEEVTVVHHGHTHTGGSTLHGIPAAVVEDKLNNSALEVTGNLAQPF